MVISNRTGLARSGSLTVQMPEPGNRFPKHNIKATLWPIFNTISEMQNRYCKSRWLEIISNLRIPAARNK